MIYAYVMMEDTNDILLGNLINMISHSSMELLNAGYIAVKNSRQTFVTRWLQTIMQNDLMVIYIIQRQQDQINLYL